MPQTVGSTVNGVPGTMNSSAEHEGCPSEDNGPGGSGSSTDPKASSDPLNKDPAEDTIPNSSDSESDVATSRRKRRKTGGPPANNKRQRPSTSKPLYGLVVGAMRDNQVYGNTLFRDNLRFADIRGTEVPRTRPIKPLCTDRAKATKRFNRRIAAIIASVCKYVNMPIPPR